MSNDQFVPTIPPGSQPSLNDAQQNNFALVINQLPGVSFKCRRVSMPGFTVPTRSPDNPKLNILLPGGKFEFDLFTARFIVDDDLTNWFALVNWIEKSTTTDEGDMSDLFGDFSVIIPTLYGKAGNVIRYIDAFPISVEPFELDAGSDGSAVECGLTIAYNSFAIDKG